MLCRRSSICDHGSGRMICKQLSEISGTPQLVNLMAADCPSVDPGTAHLLLGPSPTSHLDLLETFLDLGYRCAPISSLEPFLGPSSPKNDVMEQIFPRDFSFLRSNFPGTLLLEGNPGFIIQFPRVRSEALPLP